MRIKILLVGDDPASLVADGQLLRERGLLVFTAFNIQNITELANEIRPDVVFFDPSKANNPITDAYNSFVDDTAFAHIPVIYTLSDDDLYLVTRKRSVSENKTANIADNIMDAIKAALWTSNSYHKKSHKIHLAGAMVHGTAARA